MSANNPTVDYDKNNKPLIKVSEVVPFGKKSYQQGDMNKAPVVPATASQSAFGSNVMPKNGVTSTDSTRLQKASKLPGRVSDGTSHSTLSS